MCPWPTVRAVVFVAVAVVADPASAEPAQAGRERAASSADIERLDAELKAQRQIIIQMMQVEQQHHDLLLKLIQSASGGPPGGAGNHAMDTPPASPPAGAAVAEPPAPAVRKAAERMAVVTGRVQTAKGVSEVYVFAQDVHGPSARGRVAEIAQRDRKFVPSTLVVQRGTRVVFPNYDAIYHNVFSPSETHPFDLGSYRAGDSPQAIEMTSPGVVDVFCNMHAKMHSSILVVPSSVWTRVNSDGSFRLDNVPVGTRKLIAWSPQTQPAELTIEVGSGGGTATFNLVLQPEHPHNNKYGVPYPQYPQGPN